MSCTNADARRLAPRQPSLRTCIGVFAREGKAKAPTLRRSHSPACETLYLLKIHQSRKILWFAESQEKLYHQKYWLLAFLTSTEFHCEPTKPRGHACGRRDNREPRK